MFNVLNGDPVLGGKGNVMTIVSTVFVHAHMRACDVSLKTNLVLIHPKSQSHCPYSESFVWVPENGLYGLALVKPKVSLHYL